MSTASNVARRVAVLALVVVLVAQPMAAPVLASSPSVPDDPCEIDAADAGEYAVLPILLGYDAAKCNEQQQERARAEQMVQNATWADMYASALAQDDLAKGSLTPISNHLEDSKTYARTIAKTEAVELFNNDSNGLNKSQIKAQVNDSIEAYYATMQSNVLTAYEANSNQAYYVYNASNNTNLDEYKYAFGRNQTNSLPTEPGVWAGQSYMRHMDGDDGDLHDWKYELDNKTATLLDGSTENISVLTRYTSDTRIYVGPLNTTGTYQGSPKINTEWTAFYILEPGSPVTNVDNYNRSNSAEMLDETEYRRVYVDVIETANNSKREAAQFVDLLYNNYNRSTGVDISEVLNPNDLVSQWNTDYNSTGYYGWIAATLGLTGLEGNVNASFAINYTPRVDHLDSGNYTLSGNGTHDYAFVNGSTYNLSGTLMTDWDPNPNESYAFKRGETYDTANSSVPVLFIEQVNSTSSRVVRLNGTFTIDTLTNVKTGKSINSTGLEEQNYQTWNESSSVQEIRDLLEYRNESVTINEAGVGGGGGGIDLGSLGLGTLAIGALAGLLLLAGGGSGFLGSKAS